jgi:hypothetical protein
MAVVTTKSTVIGNRDATPQTTSRRVLGGAPVLHARGVVAITSGDNTNSVLRFCQVPSNALIDSITVSAPDIGTTTTMHLGLYRTTGDGGAVVDADFFRATLSLKDGAISRSEQIFGNVVTVANSEKLLWEHLNLASDPGCNYDICGTLTGDADAGGSVLVEVEYVV